jgi:hypothetical protein
VEVSDQHNAGDWLWPLWSVEMDLEGGKGITFDHIASYAYPPGVRARYTLDGARRIVDLGTVELIGNEWLDVLNLGAVPDERRRARR